jgi:hypothetical protein
MRPARVWQVRWQRSTRNDTRACTGITKHRLSPQAAHKARHARTPASSAVTNRMKQLSHTRTSSVGFFEPGRLLLVDRDKSVGKDVSGAGSGGQCTWSLRATTTSQQLAGHGRDGGDVGWLARGTTVPEYKHIAHAPAADESVSPPSLGGLGAVLVAARAAEQPTASE